MCVLLAAAVSLYMTAIAQEKAAVEKKGFLILSIGPSFPVGDFNSKRLDNDHAAYAKTGFNIDLQGGYHFVKNFGVGGSAFFSLYSFNEQRLKDQMVQEGLIPSGTNFSVDHWKYYGVVAGPIVTLDVSNKTFIDFSVMTGVVSANSPKAIVMENGNTATLFEDWATAIPVKVNGGMRFLLGQNSYLSTGLNYMYMEPEFSIGDDRVHQKITAWNVIAGIGFRF